MTPFKLHRPLVTTALALLLTLAGAQPAAAQSVRELREENQTLRTELADLTTEMAAATAEIERLKAEIASMIAGQATQDTPPAALPPLPVPRVTVDETKPEGSPRAALAALKKSYAEATKNLPSGNPGSRERRKYVQTLKQWSTAQQRELRRPVQWQVLITKPFTPAGRNRVRCTMQAIDPVTGTLLGRPFEGTVARAVASRLSRPGSKVDLSRPLNIKGIMQPRVHINESRPDADAFDFPPFIGPFAEFSLTVEISSLTPPTPKKPDPTDKTTTSAAKSGT